MGVQEHFASRLELLRDGFRQDVLENPGLQCTLYQEHCGRALGKSLENPERFRYLYQHHVRCLSADSDDTWRALYFEVHSAEGHCPRLPRELWNAPIYLQLRHQTQYATALQYRRYATRAIEGGRLLKQMKADLCAAYDPFTSPIERWTWAQFDWSWRFDHRDPRFVDRLHQFDPNRSELSIRPEKLRELAEKEEGPLDCCKWAREWTTSPPKTFTSRIHDISAKSIEFIDWLLENGSEEEDSANSLRSKYFGDLTLDYDRYLITRKGFSAPVKLDRSPLLFAMLVKFVKRRGVLCSRAMLEDAWTECDLEKPDERRLDSQVAKLRKALRPIGLTLKNSRKLGWRLVEAEAGPTTTSQGKTTANVKNADKPRRNIAGSARVRRR